MTQLLVYGFGNSLCIRLKLSFCYSMSAFVQLYPIPLSDISGAEDSIIFWHVKGFVEIGEVMKWGFP